MEIARCLVSDPDIILLDEPFAGIDPVTVQSIQGIIQELSNDGISILITDHAALEILQTVDYCYVISDGTVLFHGEPDDVRNHPEVKRKYFSNKISSPVPLMTIGTMKFPCAVPRIPFIRRRKNGRTTQA